MPRSQLRWRALAVLGALLSIIVDWPISLAMPTTNNKSLVTKTNPFYDLCMNCGTTHSSNNLTSNERFLTISGGNTNNDSNKYSDNSESDDRKYSKNEQNNNNNSPMIMPLTTLSSIDKGIVSNSHRSLPPERLMRVYNKRKRKKLSVARVTVDLLHSIQTHNTASSFNSDVNNLIVNRNHHIDSNRNSNNESNDSNDSNDSGSFSVNTDDDVESISRWNPITVVVTDTTSSFVVSDDDDKAMHYLSRTDRSVHPAYFRHHRKVNDSSNLDRNERSANHSHISGPARKIQLFIKNRWMQILPDGTINGTQDDSSDYTILQRTTVDVGQIKIQGVATCLFLCMDQCGAVYGSKIFTDDCVFNESMEQHHYNTYSSTYNSNSRRTLYLALNRHGEPRKLQIPPSRPLGKLATYTKSMTSTVDEDRVEKLIARTFGANRIKHGLRQLCDAGKPLIELTTKILKSQPKCNLLSNSNTSNGHGVPAAATAPFNEKLTRLGSHRSSSNNNNSTTNSNGNHSSSSGSQNKNGNVRKKKKKRRCRLDENEQEHNCHRPGPQALRKRAQKFKCSPEQTPEDCAQQRRKNNKNKKGSGGAGGITNPMSNKKRKNGGGRKGKTQLTRAPRTTTTTTTEVETTTASVPATTTILSIQSQADVAQINYQQLTTVSQEDDNVSTEDSQPQQQTSTEIHDEITDDDDGNQSSSLGSHAQLVNGDDLLYDDDFDV